MSNFKNIEKLGLKVETCRNAFGDKDFVITAISLEALLQSAQVVYGHVKQGKPNYWGPRENGQFDDTHTALVICITPLKKKTKAEAALELLERLAKDPAYYSGLGTSAARAILEMKDEA